MKIRGSHVVAAALTVFTGIIVAGYYQAKHAPPPKSDFIEEILALQSSLPASGGSGSLPPIDADPGMTPKIELETTHLDMGVVRNDEVTHTNLKVYNRGKAPLTISKIDTTCACTLGNLAPDRATIPPGREAEIRITMNPFRIPGFHSKKTLTVFSNDPITPSLSFEVEALVDPEFEMIPDAIDFGVVNKGETPQVRMLIRQLQEPLLEISEVNAVSAHTVEGGAPDILYSFEKRPEFEWMEPGKAEYWITAELTPLAPPGPILRYFAIKTNLKRMALMPGTVKGRVNAPYILAPAFPQPLVIHDPSGKTTTAPLTIRSAAQIEIDNIHFNPSRLTVSVQPGEEPNTTVLLTGFAPGAPQGNLLELLMFDVVCDGVHYTEQVMVRGYVLGFAPAAAGEE